MLHQRGHVRKPLFGGFQTVGGGIKLGGNLSRPEKSNLPAAGFSEVRIAEAVERPVFPEARQASMLRIEVGGIQMTADSAYPAEKLAELLRVLMQSC